MTSIETLMRASNPVMDPSTDFSEEEIQAFALLTRTRSGIVDVQQLTKPIEPEKKQRRGWLVAAAAFAVVIIFVGAAILLARPAAELPAATTPPTTQAVTPTTDAAPPTTQAAPPTTVAAAVEDPAAKIDAEALAFAQGLMAELNAGDTEAAAARFPDTMTFRSDFFSLTQIPGWLVHGVAMDSTYELGECKTITGGVTRCEWFRTSENEPYYPAAEDVIYQFRLEDGIPAFTMITHQKAGWWDTEIQFMNWMADNYGEAATEVYRFPGSLTGGPRFDQPVVSAVLKKEYVPLWKASLDG